MGILVFGFYMFCMAAGFVLTFTILPKNKKQEILEFINSFQGV